MGLWQGFIAPFVFVISLFKSGLNIYDVYNNGACYNFGYLFGLMCFFGGGHSIYDFPDVAACSLKNLKRAFLLQSRTKIREYTASYKTGSDIE